MLGEGRAPKKGSAPARGCAVTAGPPPFPPHARVGALPPSPRLAALARRGRLSGGKGGSVGPLRCRLRRRPRVRRNQRLPARSQSLPTSHPSGCPSPAHRPAGGHWSRRGHRPRSRRRPRALAPAILRRRVAASLPAPLGGPRRPGGVAPRPWWRLQCPLRGQAPPPTAGCACGRAAATPAVGLCRSRPVAARPARIRYSRACGLAASAVRCDCMQSHLPADTCLLPASPALAATCSPSIAPVLACQGLRRASGAVAGDAGDP